MQELDKIRDEALADIQGGWHHRGRGSGAGGRAGPQGRLTAAQAMIKQLPNEQKPAFGQALNAVRAAITEALETKKAQLAAAADLASRLGIDVTMPPATLHQGGLHPLTQIKHQTITALRQMGFTLAAGPEIETEFHCFDALNTPADHPARNETDTFYFDSGKLLRTHTSTVQIRTMEETGPRCGSSRPARPTAATKSMPRTCRFQSNRRALRR